MGSSLDREVKSLESPTATLNSERPLMSIKAYHAHVYFDDDTFDQAKALCEAAASTFGIKMGRLHRGPVGPHPRGSCQLSVPLKKGGEIFPWLMENRNGLTVFAHGLSGDDYQDHTDYVMWLGESEELKPEVFDGPPAGP